MVSKNRRCTTVSFSPPEKIPTDRDKMIISPRTVQTPLWQALTSHDGHGSRNQVVSYTAARTLSTSSWESQLKWSKPGLEDREGASSSLILSNVVGRSRQTLSAEWLTNASQPIVNTLSFHLSCGNGVKSSNCSKQLGRARACRHSGRRTEFLLSSLHRHVIGFYKCSVRCPRIVASL